MSKYTTELRFICESLAGLLDSEGYNSIDSILEKSWDKIFSFDFPIYDENYRKPLCIKILKNFYTREISEETFGLWKLRLDSKMNLIMPYYNQLYNSELIKFEPLIDVNTTTSHKLDKTGKTTGTNSTNTNSNIQATNKNLYSDTPQGSLQNVENETYLTNARLISDNQSNTNIANNNYSENITNTDEYIENITGKSAGASYSKMLMEFRESFLNIDQQIIEELNPLFMLIW